MHNKVFSQLRVAAFNTELVKVVVFFFNVCSRSSFNLTIPQQTSEKEKRQKKRTPHYGLTHNSWRKSRPEILVYVSLQPRGKWVAWSMIADAFYWILQWYKHSSRPQFPSALRVFTTMNGAGVRERSRWQSTVACVASSLAPSASFGGLGRYTLRTGTRVQYSVHPVSLIGVVPVGQ